MAKIMSVEEALASMTAKTKPDGTKVINRFNKKNFNLLMLAMANDPEFKVQVANVKNGNLDLEDVMVTKEFRKWCKKLVEKVGVDPMESERVMTKDFVIDNMEGLYDFFSAALYEYMNAGNRFDLPSREDFKGGFILADVEESTKVADAFNPDGHQYIGTFETKKKKHKILKAKSSCPTYLSEKRKIK